MVKRVALGLLALAALGLLAVRPDARVGAQEGDKGPEKGTKVVTTKSGLKYQDLKVGAGAEAKKGNTVTVHYTGWLAKGGKKFDSSLDRKKPFEFELGAGDVIKGWDEGVAGMKVGGKRRLIIPYKLAYGEKGRAPIIPAKADLVFDVELLKVSK
jgi:FKBP-type peptidyl-prolyl cis-trans isomerase